MQSITANNESPDAIAKDQERDRFKQIDIAIARNQYQQDALIEILHTAQSEFGYLPTKALTYIARQMKLPLSRVYGVATFYHLFSLTPPCNHACKICLGTACYANGGDALLQILATELDLHPGETIADGQVSLTVEHCIGNCGIAPAAVFDGKVARKQSPQQVLAQIKSWLT
jgi:bidirectional [NiFe] hydrogenase diaphorase subunit